MADIKLQVVRGQVPASHVDFRGDGFIGSPEDEHRTAFETRIVGGVEIEAVLLAGAKANAVFDELTAIQPSWLGVLAETLGLAGSGPVRLQLRVYDDD